MQPKTSHAIMTAFTLLEGMFHPETLPVPLYRPTDIGHTAHQKPGFPGPVDPLRVTAQRDRRLPRQYHIYYHLSGAAMPQGIAHPRQQALLPWAYQVWPQFHLLPFGKGQDYTFAHPDDIGHLMFLEVLEELGPAKAPVS